MGALDPLANEMAYQAFRTNRLQTPRLYGVGQSRGPSFKPSPLNEGDFATQGGDSVSLSPADQSYLDQVYPQQDVQLQQSPNLNIGPLSLSGNGLDAASMAMLQAGQYMPQPRNFGQGLLGGALMGLAQSRASQAQARSQANAQSILEAHQNDVARRQEAARLLAQTRSETTVVPSQMIADQLKAQFGIDIQPGERVNNKIFDAVTAAPKTVADPDIDITAPQMQAFFRGVHYTPPPGVTTMKKSELMALGKPSAAAGTSVQPPAAGPVSARFWGNISGRGGTVPYGVLRNMKGDDLAEFTQGAMEAAGTPQGFIGAGANVAGLKNALGQMQKTKAGFDALDTLLDKSTNLLEHQLPNLPETGTQFGNTLARYWDAQMGKTGTTNFNAVLGPVQTEAARVIASGTLNGNPLTNEQKNDLQSIAGKNFTKQQIMNTLDLLTQERAFRRQGIEGSISTLQSALGMPPPAPAPAPEAPQTEAEKASIRRAGMKTTVKPNGQ